MKPWWEALIIPYLTVSFNIYRQMIIVINIQNLQILLTVNLQSKFNVNVHTFSICFSFFFPVISFCSILDANSFYRFSFSFSLTKLLRRETLLFYDLLTHHIATDAILSMHILYYRKSANGLCNWCRKQI